MTIRSTVVIIVVLGAMSAVFVVFMVGVTRALDPYPQREADLQRLAAIQREEDVRPEYDTSHTAIITVREGQKSGPVIIKEINDNGEVKIDLLHTSITGTEVVSSTLRAGELAYSCSYREIRLLNATAESANFKLVRGGVCGYCWHMYQPEIYDDYVTGVSAG